MTRVLLNGEEKQVAAATIAQLVVELGLEGQPVAVERNREVVRRRDHDTTALAEGDVLEVVTLVGGG